MFAELRNTRSDRLEFDTNAEILPFPKPAVEELAKSDAVPDG